MVVKISEASGDGLASSEEGFLRSDIAKKKPSVTSCPRKTWPPASSLSSVGLAGLRDLAYW